MKYAKWVVVAGVVVGATAAATYLARDAEPSIPNDGGAFAYLSSSGAGSLVPPATTSLGLLAHHGTGDRLCPNLVEYIRQLAPNFQRFLLVTNYRTLSNADDLPENCTVVFAPNQGLDIGKHMYVLHHLRAPALQRLGLFNDSAFVVRDVHPFFEGARDKGWDVWGMTLSQELSNHIQSYFVVADSAPAAQHLLRFFNKRTMDHVQAPTYKKFDLVKEFEVGMSRHMARRFALHAWYSMYDVVRWEEPRDVPPNPSACYWDVLLLMGCPLLKKFRLRVVNGADVMPLFEPRYAATISGIDDKTFARVP